MNELRGMSEQFEQLRNKCRKNIEEMMEENSRRWFCLMRVNKLSAYDVKKAHNANKYKHRQRHAYIQYKNVLQI